MARCRSHESAKHNRSPQRRLASALVACGVLLLAADAQPQDEPAKGANKPAQSGRLVHVPLPISGDADMHVIRAISKALAEVPKNDARPILVLEFTETARRNDREGDARETAAGRGSNFGRALSLARYLSGREMSRAKTVAYIPKRLEGHGVLVAMACEEIIMAPDAVIGKAGIDESPEEAIGPSIRSGYREIADSRRTIPAEVAAAMLDKNVEVLKVETEVSPEFVLRSELEDLKKRRAVQSETVLNRPGQFAEFTGREVRELGFVKYLASDREAVAKALSLPRSSLDDDPSLWGDWRPVRVTLRGPMKTQLASRTERTIDDQVRSREANFICLWIDSAGGSLADSIRLANYLASLDRSQVRTVAYVPAEARADAALVALACDQLVMGPDAVLGGPGAEVLSDDELELAQQVLRDSLMPKKQRGWSLAAATIDSTARVYRFTHKSDGGTAYFNDTELQEQDAPNDWERGDEVTRPGETLRLRGDRAEQLGLAQFVVPNMNVFKERYGLHGDLELAEPGWAHFLIDALAATSIQWLLLLIGGAALYAELQSPGVGVGGFVAGVCFLLYFWSKHLDGTAGWLEVLLFAAGVCCVLLEIFVLPGAAVFGLGGGLLIISSLVLASQTFVLPRNDYQIAQLRDSLLGLFGVGVGVITLAILMHRYLPHTPLFSNVMLQPPSDAELEDISHRESLVDWQHLVGLEGLATTQLTPSGKARFGEEIVDVIADGEAIDRGTPVQVVAVHGNRVVVRSAAIDG